MALAYLAAVVEKVSGGYSAHRTAGRLRPLQLALVALEESLAAIMLARLAVILLLALC
jgi:hypothetical protein